MNRPDDHLDLDSRIKTRRFLDRVNEMQSELSVASVKLHGAVNAGNVDDFCRAVQQVWSIREESRSLFEQMDDVRTDYV